MGLHISHDSYDELEPLGYLLHIPIGGLKRREETGEDSAGEIKIKTHQTLCLYVSPSFSFIFQ